MEEFKKFLRGKTLIKNFSKYKCKHPIKHIL
jgi:hypothetical protein